ncbi:MAG: hypothetical protein LBR79_03520 [Oscillospiraceae bacterium]|jgi:hypothetical protein|nr:hypothetical protein [Oscillospiraceae bacterium]
MNELKEKASYVRGLMEGFELDGSKKETKLFSAIIDLLDDIAGGVCDLDQDIEDICEEMDTMNEDIADFEDELCGDDACHCEDDCDGDCDCSHDVSKDEENL